MGNVIYKIFDMYEEYEHLCKLIGKKPKLMNDSWSDEYAVLKESQKTNGRNKKGG